MKLKPAAGSVADDEGWIAAAGRYSRVVLLARRHAIGLIFALGLAIRLALLLTPRSYFPDEIFQYLEPAHRLVFGPGIVTWEYRYGIRSWLVPMALAAPMAIGGWIAPGGGLYLLLAKLALVVFSLLNIVAAIALGRRISPRHAVFAGFIVAIWSDFAYFSAQAITEAIAVSVFLPAAALLYDRRRETPARLMLAGALIALTAVIRFQYGPAVGLFLLLRCGRDGRRWFWCASGVTLVLILSMGVDLAMGQAPFAWLAENVRLNIVSGRSHAWGMAGPLYLVAKLGENWSFWALPIALLAYVGAKHYPALGIAALANIAVHSLIAHKEFRYILLSIMILIVLAAIGTIDAIALADSRRQRGRWLGIAIIIWTLASLFTAMAPYDLRSMATPKLEAFSALRDEPGICGVALRHVDWFQTGGYAYLHRPVPLYVPDLAPMPDRALQSGAPAYNMIVARLGTDPAIPAGYHELRCFGSRTRRPDQAVCLYRRAGGCDRQASARYEINRALISLDQ